MMMKKYRLNAFTFEKKRCQMHKSKFWINEVTEVNIFHNNITFYMIVLIE